MTDQSDQQAASQGIPQPLPEQPAHLAAEPAAQLQAAPVPQMAQASPPTEPLPEQSGVHAATVVPRPTAKPSIVKMVLALVLFVVSFEAGMGGDWLAGLTGLDPTTAFLALRAACAVACVALLGGIAWELPSPKAIDKTLDFVHAFMIISAVAGVLLLGLACASVFFGDGSFDGFAGRLASVTIVCLLVGIGEEALCHGLLFGGLLAGLGTKKGGILVSAIVTAAVFGLLHVAADVDPANPLDLLQGILKTLESGLFALALCAPVLKRKNLTGAMVAHFFYDWCILAPSALTSALSLPETYVNADADTALYACILHGVIILLYLPTVIRAVKELRRMEPPRMGPFVKVAGK